MNCNSLFFRKITRLLFLSPPIIIGLYAILIAFLYFCQRSLIFPGSLTQGARDGKIIPPDRSGEIVVLKTASKIAVTGYWAPSPTNIASTGRTILFFYGNGMCLNDCWYIMEHFRALGCSVMFVDYPGYGMSGGSASDRGCYEASDAAYEYLTQQRRIDADRIVSAGWSLGSAVAIHLAAHRSVAGLMTFSAFTSMSIMAAHQYPIVPEFLIKRMLKYRFPSQETISDVRCPTLIAHGALDSLVPKSMSESLAKADNGPVTRVIIDNVGHNNILQEGGRPLYDSISGWLARLPKPIDRTSNP